MKKLLVAFVVLMMMAPMALFSQNNMMIVHLKNGLVAEFLFKYEPVITFTDTDIVLTTSMGSITYPLANLTKFTFSKKDLPTTEVEEIEEDVRKVTFSIDEYTINIDGAKADEAVYVIASDGKVLDAYKTDKEGSLSFSIADLPDGTYIIRSEEITFKILKK